MPTYLIVANQTMGGAELIDHVRSVMAEGPCDFHLVVPATPPREHLTWKEHLTWTEGEAKTIAAHRLEEGLDRIRAMGAEATGEVGDASPILAVDDALRHREVDGVIVTTLPVGVSRWLKLSLPDRIERKHHVPVTHIVVQPKVSAPQS
jgi:hypothetical protein